MGVSEPLDTPSFRALVDLVDGLLDTQQHSAVLSAVEAADRNGDPAPRRTLDWLRSFRAEADRLPLKTPPPLLRQRLRRLMTVRSGAAAPLRRVRADLVTDSRRTERLAGVRGPDNGPVARYQLTFEAVAVAVIVLDVATGSDGTVALRGQVLPQIDTPPVFEVVAIGPSGVVASSAGDELGGFSLTGAPCDVATLLLTNDELEIRICPLLSDAG
jgi:hypothetical protein